MKATLKTRLMQLGLVLATTAGFTGALWAGPPNDAGFKARGMHEQTRVMTRTYVAPPVARQAFSYEPAAAAPVVQPQRVQPAAPQVARPNPTVRRFSYEPVAPVTRTWTHARRHTGYGGDYGSKATLYK